MGIPFRFETGHILGISRAEATWNCGAARQEVDEVRDSEEHRCGKCQGCCIHLPIPAGGVCTGPKPAGMKCPHLADHGCQIYEGRPRTCRQFQCVWLTEPSWPLAWRPEHSGLLCLREEVDSGLSAALVYEIERDATARPAARAILEKLQESTVVVVLVNLQQQRQALRGHHWVEPAEEGVRRPHFLMPVHSMKANSPDELRDAC